MVAPILIGAHPSRHESEPMELGVMLSRLTGAPLELLGTFWFDRTPGRTAAHDHQENLTREVREALDRMVAHSGAPIGDVTVHAACGSAATLLHETAARIGAGLVYDTVGKNACPLLLESKKPCIKSSTASA